MVWRAPSSGAYVLHHQVVDARSIELCMSAPSSGGYTCSITKLWMRAPSSYTCARGKWGGHDEGVRVALGDSQNSRFLSAPPVVDARSIELYMCARKVGRT